MLNGTSRAGKYCSNRVTEWILAACMLNWGLTTFVTPLTIHVGAFRYLALPEGLGIPWQLFAVVMTATGSAWVCGLIYNGSGLPWTSRIRFVCSLICCITLAYMSLCLAWLSPDTGTFSLGVGSHAFWGVGALISCLRAGLDALGETDSRVVNVAVYGDGHSGGPVDTDHPIRKFGPIPDFEIIRRDLDSSFVVAKRATVP